MFLYLVSHPSNLLVFSEVVEEVRIVFEVVFDLLCPFGVGPVQAVVVENIPAEGVVLTFFRLGDSKLARSFSLNGRLEKVAFLLGVKIRLEIRI